MSNKLFRLAFAIFLLGYVSILATSRLYPFVDLPNHLATATILRFLNAGNNNFADYFRIPALIGPNTFHLLFCSLPFLGSVETANRILLIAYAISVPSICLAIIVKLDGNRWFSLLSFLFLFNFSLSWGFMGLALAIPVVLLFVYFLLSRFESTHPAKSILFALLLALLFFFHALASLFGLAIYLTYLVLRLTGRTKTHWTEFLAPIPLLVLIFNWWIPRATYAGESTISFLLRYYSSEFVPSAWRRGAFLVFDNYSLFNGLIGYLIAFVFSGICLSIFVILVASRHRQISDMMRRDRRLLLIPLLISLCGACCLVLPNRLPDQHFLYERFSAFFFLFVVLFAGVFGKLLKSRIWSFLVTALVIVHLSLYADYFYEFNQVNRAFTRALFPCDDHSSVLTGLPYADKFRGQHAYFHFQDYYIVWCQGIAANSFVDFRFGTVKRGVDSTTLPPFDPYAIADPAIYEQYYNIDYILVRGAIPQEVARFFAKYEVKSRAAEWTLYRAPSSK